MQKVSKKTAPVEEKLPVHESLEVLDHVDISKRSKWWSAIVVVNSFGRKQICLYLWQKKEDKWKRIQKFIVRNKADWELIKKTVDKLVEKL
jgi:hypothetical protein